MNDRVRRLARRAAWLLLVLGIVGAIVWTAANVAGTAQLQTELRALQASGYVTSHAGLAPPKLPVNENAAPFFTAAFALFVKPPEEDLFNENQDAWPEKIRGLSVEQRTAVKTWLDGNRDAFEMVTRARTRAKCRYEHDFTQGWTMVLPEVSEIIALSRAYQVRALLQAMEGDIAGAQDSVRSILTLGESLRDEPVLVEQLVRFVTVNIAMGTIDECVTEASSEQDLAAWTALLPGEDFLKGALERGFRGELAMAAGMLEGSPKTFWEVLGGAQVPWWSCLSHPLLRFDGARYLEIMKRAVEVSRTPYVDGRAVFEAVEHEQQRIGWYRPVCGMLLPSLTGSLRSATTAQALVAVVRAGLEAEQVRRKSGRYPERTDVTDPFTSKPLKLDAGRISAVQPTQQPEPIEWVLRGAKK